MQRTLKRKGQLTSIKDADGKLVTDYLILKEVIVTEVAKMALGQKSKLFTSRGQQIMKEVTIICFRVLNDSNDDFYTLFSLLYQLNSNPLIPSKMSSSPILNIFIH